MLVGQSADDIGGIVGRNDSYSALLNLNYNLFKGGADFARQKETAELSVKAMEIRNRTIREVIESMQLSWNALQTAKTQLSFLQGHVNAAVETEKLYREQFLLGKRTLLDLLDAENEMLNAKNSYIEGQYNVRFAKYRVLNSMGQLTQFLKVPLPAAADAQWKTVNTSLPMSAQNVESQLGNNA